MSKVPPKISRTSRPAERAPRVKKTDNTLVFTKAELARQHKAARRFLALPTITVGDPKVSETGVIQKCHGIAG